MSDFHLFLFFAAFVLLPCDGNAQPRLEIDASDIVTHGSARQYTFETFFLDAPDGERRYRIQIARPRRDAPVAGYSVFFLLDGNAAVAALDDALLDKLAATRHPPVLVAIGYDTPLRFDVVARAYDYTPPLSGKTPQPDPLDAMRKNGGAAQFLDFIEQRIKPEIVARVPLDSKRQGLWGHSYGGLFVLYALLTRPETFTDYIAASPSLWWREGYLLTLEAGFARRFSGHHARLLILRGGAEGRNTRPGVSPARLALREQAVAALPVDAAAAFARRLDAVPGLRAQYRELPDLDHGPMFAASLAHILHAMTEETP